MGIINILDKQTANLIAAGEVVERPSSAIKEMLENCADAGADRVTVEIKNGGTSYIRICDNGKGMTRDDVPKSIMRHATSKISDGSDLEAIATFGFRGEALAAISSVSRLRILTKCRDENEGTIFECDFGEKTELSDAGCPDGTTITVENIFENVPARRKFLKKDSTEALSVGAVCEKFALSRPEIALTFISDNNIKMQTPGDGDLKSAIYATMGRDFATSLLNVDYTYSGVRIHGFIARPEFCRPNRNLQNFFVNNRYIRSRTMMAAVEEGFRGFCPTGKFPACVLFCDVDLRLVDVNVHPAKLEIKFSDERKIFDSVYFAVKNALSVGVTFKGFGTDEAESEPIFPTVKKTEQVPVISVTESKPAEKQEIKTSAFTPSEAKNSPVKASFNEVMEKPLESVKVFVPDKAANSVEVTAEVKAQEKTVEKPSSGAASPKDEKVEIVITEPTFSSLPDEKASAVSSVKASSPERLEIQTQSEVIPTKRLTNPIYIGEVFDTYIIVQYGKSMYIIDKHAAHERIIYEHLKNPEHENNSQYLLEPISVTLTPKEAMSAGENKKYFEKIGFEFDEFGVNTFLIRSIPTPISQNDVKDVFTFLSGKLAEGNSRSAGEIFDRALFTAACRAAIKGGDKNTECDNRSIVDEIFSNDAVLYCPHGRPVISEFSHEKLNKMFDRP